MSTDSVRPNSSTPPPTLNDPSQQSAADPETNGNDAPAQQPGTDTQAANGDPAAIELDATVLPQGVAPSSGAPPTDPTDAVSTASVVPDTEAGDPAASGPVLLFDLPPARPDGAPTVGPETLALIDVAIANGDAQAVVQQYGAGPIDTSSPVAQELIARYGAARFEAMTRYDMAMEQVLDRAEAAMKAGRTEGYALVRAMDSGKKERVRDLPLGTPRDVPGAPPGWRQIVQEGAFVVPFTGGEQSKKGLYWAWQFDPGAYYSWYTTQPGAENQILATAFGRNTLTTTTYTSSLVDNEGSRYDEWQMFRSGLGATTLDGQQTYTLRSARFKAGGSHPPTFSRNDGLIDYALGTRLVNESADTVLFDPVAGWVTPLQNIYEEQNFFEKTVSLVPALALAGASFGIGSVVGAAYGATAGAYASAAFSGTVGYAFNTRLQGESFSWENLGKQTLRQFVQTAVSDWVKNLKVTSPLTGGSETTIDNLGVFNFIDDTTGAVTYIDSFQDRFLKYMLTGTGAGAVKAVFGESFSDGFISSVAGQMAGDLGKKMQYDLALMPEVGEVERIATLRLITTIENMVRIALTGGDPAKDVATAWLKEAMKDAPPAPANDNATDAVVT